MMDEGHTGGPKLITVIDDAHSPPVLTLTWPARRKRSTARIAVASVIEPTHHRGAAGAQGDILVCDNEDKKQKPQRLPLMINKLTSLVNTCWEPDGDQFQAR